MKDKTKAPYRSDYDAYRNCLNVLIISLSDRSSRDRRSRILQSRWHREHLKAEVEESVGYLASQERTRTPIVTLPSCRSGGAILHLPIPGHDHAALWPMFGGQWVWKTIRMGEVGDIAGSK